MNLRTRLPGVLVLLAPLFAACNGDGGVDFDRTSPTVTSTTPPDGATGVDPNTIIAATLSEDLQGSSVTTTTFTVTPAGGMPIPGTIITSDRTATFTPAARLAFSTTYTARLTTGVTDEAGNGLSQPHTWTFTTIINPGPTVLGTRPAAGTANVAANSTITVTFSEPVALGSITSATFQVAPAHGANIAGALGVNGAEVTFEPAAPLLVDTTYNVVLTTGITDLEGAPLASPYTWSFRTIVNGPPSANAGTDQDVNHDDEVTLSGGGSDPDGHAITYRWTQVFGPDVTAGAGYLDGQMPTFTAPENVSTLRFELRTTDEFGMQSQASVVQINVMEDKTRAIFVSPLGDDNNAGNTRSAPVKTITRGITRAVALGGGADLYVMNGTYDESISLQTGVSIYGGYQSGTWLRDFDDFPVIVTGGPSMITVSGFNVSDVTLSGLRIRTPREALVLGLSVHTVFLNQTQNITISNNQITAGDAGPGSGGQFGVNGVGGGPGTVGANAVCTPTPQGGARGAAGQPGSPQAGSQLGVAGGDGGNGGSQNVSGESGANGSASASLTGGVGGPGGTAAAPDGVAGASGANGTSGQNGAGGEELGTLSAAGYVPPDGANGTSGTPGSGGGGGGGGAGTATGAGGGGGGGGASGGGGNLGQGGKGGGGSFAIVVRSSTDIVIHDNLLVTGSGGAGGSGGVGGTGGPGGLGALGGSGCASGGGGGRGGNGGSGGTGGHGGGGGGGPSIGVFTDAASTVTIGIGNDYQIASAGAGGFSQGNQGAAGLSAQTHTIP